jgi:cobalt/nickel transport system permease protein
LAHIPDGVLSTPVLALGGLASVVGVGLGARRLDPVAIPRTALLSAVLFVASLVHFPVGPSSVHLLMNGLAGILLGWAIFPAMLVALLLQAVLFGFGGLVVLGVNIFNMAAPGLVAGWLFRRLGRGPWAGGMAAGLAVAGTALLVAASLAASGREFWPAAQLVLLTHLPVMAIEGAVVAACVGLLARVKPEMLA